MTNPLSLSAMGTQVHPHEKYSHSNDPPPPAYDEATSSKHVQKNQGNHDSEEICFLAESLQDMLGMLKAYDTVFIVDDSSSMQEENRWSEAGKALSRLAALVAPYDPDGIDLHFLNSPQYVTGARARDIESAFQLVKPSGGTPIGRVLDVLLGQYMDTAEEAKANGLGSGKPANFIIITDGEPTDSPEDVILEIAHRLDVGRFPLSQLGIQFVQVGTSSIARKYLKSLDDTLMPKYGIRDIVDTTPYNGRLTAEMLLKIAVGGINRRVDREGASVNVH
ncbi:hypothetical protein HWV62_9087 [Athelia sp. TMB]|nr:hypothetical protein HWV62_9087 [Athelia sp. TMB]